MSRHVSEVDTVAEQEVRSRIRAHVLEHLDQVTERVVAAIQTEIPAYATLSRDQVAEVTDIASWGTLRILDLWVEDLDRAAASWGWLLGELAYWQWQATRRSDADAPSDRNGGAATTAASRSSRYRRR